MSVAFAARNRRGTAVFLCYDAAMEVKLMRCPRCESNQYLTGSPCPNCQFSGDAQALERLSNLKFLLSESFGWQQLPASFLKTVQDDYGRQLRQTEVELGLRQPPPKTVEEVQALRQQQKIHQRFIERVTIWVENKWVPDHLLTTILTPHRDSIQAIEEQLIDAPPQPVYDKQALKRQDLEITRQLLAEARQLWLKNRLTKEGLDLIKSKYEMNIASLEADLGIRPLPSPKPAKEKKAAAPKPKAIKPPQPPREPWSWDRFWETLLSERTLQAILFLGVILLFSASVFWVARNWERFEPIVQIAFLGTFTALFYGAGTYVTKILKLRESGIALFGVASLLIPLDFFTFYLSGGFPPDSGPTVWLVASLVCWLAYWVVAYLLKAPFFGYLIGIATASIGLAIINLNGVPLVWWQTVVAAVGFIFGLIGFLGLHNRSENRLAFLAAPFQKVGLLFVSSVMIFGFSWRFIFGTPYLETVPPLAISWWLGGVILTLAVPKTGLPGLAWAAAASFPIAIWFTAQSVLPPQVATGWYTLGWALLLPLYIILAHRVEKIEIDAANNYGRIILIVAAVLTAVAALWSMTSTSAASVVHPLLAATMIFTARLWQRPRWLWLAGLFMLSGSAAWQGARSATLPELTLPWGLLALLFIVAAINLRATKVRYDAPLFGLGLAQRSAGHLAPRSF